MDEGQKNEIEFKARGIVNDNQFSEDAIDFNTYELPEAISAEKDVDIGLDLDTNNRLPKLYESMEPERTPRNGRYNLRKSLAWDSAFFTSAGVLDAEELSSMITGLEKSEKKLLPGIEEDITESTESISTLGSDHFTLETHEEEDDLFVDIRASIQRSSKKASNFRNSSSNTSAVEVDSTAISSLKKEDLSSQNKQNPKPEPKKTGDLPTVRMSKCQPKQNIVKLGPGKPIKLDSGHSQMKSTVKIGEINSILPKPPKAISKSIYTSMTTIKRDSIGTSRVKSECVSSKLGTTASSKVAQPSKAFALSGARRALPKPIVSSKPSLLGSTIASKVQPARSSTSSDSSSSISSGIPSKSSLMTARRNPVKSGNVGRVPTGSMSKTPSRALPKNKPSASALSDNLMSTQISSSVSPASSISEWSSASSSSSMAYQRSNNSRISLDASSCKSIDGDIVHLDMRNHSDNLADREESEGANNKVPKKSSTQMGALQAPVKPSGLRMPSPKIGFFDGVKSSARTPNGPPQFKSGLQTEFPKNGAAISTPARSSNVKTKSTKVPPARTVTSLPGIKANSPKITSSPTLQEMSHASESDSCVSTDVKNFPSLCLEVDDNLNGKSCEIEEKVQIEDGVKQVVEASTGFFIKENLGDLNNEMDLNIHKDIGTGDIKIASVEGTEYDVLVSQTHHLKNYSSPISVTDGKENDHGEGLTGIDIDSKVSCPKYELVRDLSGCLLPRTTTPESTAGRAPFVPKNFCSGNDSVDMSKECANHVAEKTFAYHSLEQKENSN